MRFCLKWHAHEFEKSSNALLQPSSGKGKGARMLQDTKHLSAYAHFLLLQQIGLIGAAPAASGGGVLGLGFEGLFVGIHYLVWS